ncbi:MAG: site-specific DNA-methyltransferase [Bdellovibrionales bacterium]
MEYADMVADNKIAELSEVDMAMVNADFVQFGPDFDVDLLGIPGFEIEPFDAMSGDEDEAPKLPVVPKTKLGDVYILGRHRLLCGDATNAKHVQALMKGETADMVFTDPPYNVDYEGKTEDALKIKNDKMGNSEFRDFLLKVFKNYISVSKPGSAIYVCHADSNGLAFRSTLVEAGWLLKQCLVWVKQQFVMGRQDYHWQHEPILYGWMPGASHHWFGNRKQSTVWQFDRPMRSLEHPTMKPVEMIQHALLNSSKKDDLVLDFFGGSGSTLIACEKTKRRCFTMELDPKYCDVVVTRWEKYTGEKAKRIR